MPTTERQDHYVTAMTRTEERSGPVSTPVLMLACRCGRLLRAEDSARALKTVWKRHLRAAQGDGGSAHI